MRYHLSVLVTCLFWKKFLEWRVLYGIFPVGGIGSHHHGNQRISLFLTSGFLARQWRQLSFIGKSAGRQQNLMHPFTLYALVVCFPLGTFVVLPGFVP